MYIQRILAENHGTPKDKGLIANMGQVRCLLEP